QGRRLQYPPPPRPPRRRRPAHPHHAGEGIQHAQQMGGVQRGQLERERPALHREEILDIPAEDGDGHLPGLQHRAAGVRLQDQGQLLREVVRLLPRQLQQHDRPDEPPVYRHQCA
ncbi:hypothetical protein ACJX0J_013252, partial [Zea mays]